MAGHLTQSALALAAGTPQPSVARVESGRCGLTVASLLDRLGMLPGRQLAVVPSTRTTAATTAAAIRGALVHRNDEQTAHRSVIRPGHDLAAEDDAERVALCITPPPPTGDERYDVFIAGVVEYRLTQERLPLPKWLRTAARLDTPWFVDESDGEDTVDATPPALRARGVIIGEWELASRSPSTAATYSAFSARRCRPPDCDHA